MVSFGEIPEIRASKKQELPPVNRKGAEEPPAVRRAQVNVAQVEEGPPIAQAIIRDYFLSIQNGDVKKVNQLLEANNLSNNVDRIRDRKGKTGFVWALEVAHVHPEMRTFFLERGANVNVTWGQSGKSPLTQAARALDAENVTWLLAKGAKADPRAPAFLKMKEELVPEMRRAETVEVQGVAGEIWEKVQATLHHQLMMAAKRGRHAEIARLFPSVENPMRPDGNGLTPAGKAAINGFPKVAKQLFKLQKEHRSRGALTPADRIALEFALDHVPGGYSKKLANALVQTNPGKPVQFMEDPNSNR